MQRGYSTDTISSPTAENQQRRDNKAEKKESDLTCRKKEWRNLASD
jgi:hypothetical protein